jgi:probable rRNA maturation factor
VYVAPEVAARTAAELGISEEEELVRLVVHGILHLLGHDHPEGDDRYASPMFRLQEELVGRLTRGIP